MHRCQLQYTRHWHNSGLIWTTCDASPLVSVALLSNITIVLHCHGAACLTRLLQRVKTNFLHIMTPANHATLRLQYGDIPIEKKSNKVRQLGFRRLHLGSCRRRERSANTRMLAGANTIRETRKSRVKSKLLSYFEARRRRGRGVPSYRDRRPCRPTSRLSTERQRRRCSIWKCKSGVVSHLVSTDAATMASSSTAMTDDMLMIITTLLQSTYTEYGLAATTARQRIHST